MFRAWDHLLVAPMLPPGPWENDARLEPLCTAGGQVVLDGTERERLLGWLRALRNPRAPVCVEWRGGLLVLSQEEGCEVKARLELPAGFGDTPAPAGWPRLRLPSRDLAATLRLGDRLGVALSRDGRAALVCRGAGGAFCRVTSLSPADDALAGRRGSGHRPAA